MDKSGITYTNLTVKKADGSDLTYQLCFNYNLLCDIETEVGLNLNHAIQRIDLASANQTRALLWSMLKTAQPKITLATCGDILSADLNAARRAVADELIAALHESTSGAEPATPASTEPTDTVTSIGSFVTA